MTGSSLFHILYVIRFIEDLDSIKDRAIVCQEELNNTLAEQINNRMFVLSIVSAIFIVMLTIVIALQLWIFKKKRWFKKEVNL